MMQIYNSLSQLQEEESDRSFAEIVDTFEIIETDNHDIERVIFGGDSGYLSK